MQGFCSTALKPAGEFCGSCTTQCYTQTTKIVIRTKKSRSLQRICYPFSSPTHTERTAACYFLCRRLGGRNGCLGRHLGCCSFLLTRDKRAKKGSVCAPAKLPTAPGTLALWGMSLVHTEPGVAAPARGTSPWGTPRFCHGCPQARPSPAGRWGGTWGPRMCIK